MRSAVGCGRKEREKEIFVRKTSYWGHTHERDHILTLTAIDTANTHILSQQPHPPISTHLHNVRSHELRRLPKAVHSGVEVVSSVHIEEERRVVKEVNDRVCASNLRWRRKK